MEYLLTVNIMEFNFTTTFSVQFFYSLLFYSRFTFETFSFMNMLKLHEPDQFGLM